MADLTIGDIFTEAELDLVKKLIRETPDHLVAEQIRVQLVSKIMPRINAATKQENDDRYWSYMLVAVLNRAGVRYEGKE